MVAPHILVVITDILLNAIKHQMEKTINFATLPPSLIYTQTQKHTYWHTCTHSHTHTHTRMHAHTHTRTHTQTCEHKGLGKHLAMGIWYMASLKV